MIISCGLTITLSKLRILAHHCVRKVTKRLVRFEFSVYWCLNTTKFIFFGSELNRC